MQLILGRDRGWCYRYVTIANLNNKNKKKSVNFVSLLIVISILNVSKIIS